MSKKTLAYRIIIIILFVLCAAVHIYRVADIPFGIHVDEMGMGYDAWCLKNFGVDRYLNPYPVYLNNFGGGQSALYAYLCALVLCFSELSVFSMRLPIIVMFLISVIYGVKTIQLLGEEKETKTLLYLLMVTTLPVCIMLFRLGLDCNLMYTIAVIFFYYLLKAIKTGRYRDFVCTGVAGGILLYTYAISYVIMVLFVFLILIMLFFTKRINIRKMLCMGVPMGILALPLILVQLVNILDWQEFQIGPLTITKLFWYRAGEMSLTNLNWDSIAKCVRYIFMYDIQRSDSIPQFGTIYYVSIPIAVIGLIRSVYVAVNGLRKRQLKAELIYLLWFILIVLVGAMAGPITYRVNAAYVSVVFFLVEGITFLGSMLQDKKLRYGFYVVVAGIYAILFLQFCHYYFGGQYEAEEKPIALFDYGIEEPIAFFEQHEEYQDRLTYVVGISQGYIQYLHATLMTPMEYNSENVIDETDEYSRIRWTEAFRNYRFSMSELIDHNANYIVDRDEAEYCAMLEQAGFTVHEMEHYNVYTFDLEKLERLEISDEMTQWNAGIGEGDMLLLDTAQELNGESCVVLVGWSYNSQDDVLWESVYITADDKYYIAEPVERPDVVESTGREELLHSGFIFYLPVSEIEEASDISFICVDGKNHKYIKQKINLISCQE